MSNERVRELLSNAIDWIHEHTKGLGYDEFIRALKNIGMSEDEIQTLLKEEDL